MSAGAAFLDSLAPGLSLALAGAGVTPFSTQVDGRGVILRINGPPMRDWALWDNGGELGMQIINDDSWEGVRSFPVTGLRGQRLDAMTLLSRIWSVLHGEPIDYEFDYAEQCATINAALRAAAGAEDK